MADNSAEMDKWTYRKNGLEKRRALETTLNEMLSKKVRGLLSRVPEFKDSTCVFCYVSMSDEVQTVELLKNMLSMGKKVCVPLIRSRGIMDAAVVSSMDDFEEGKYGILTVKNEKASVIDPKEIDCAIVPGTAFGRDGSRVGMGGGFYDRYLLKTNGANRIGICFSCQIFDKVPVEKHDLFMDLIVTEKEIIKSKENEKGEKR